MGTSKDIQHCTAYSRIIAALHLQFPQENEEEFKKYIVSLRHVKGTLKGLGVDDVIEYVRADLLKKYDESVRHAAKPAPNSPLSAINDENVEMCCICRDTVGELDQTTSSCVHKFHDQCLREWLRYSSTCPTCRSYILMADEYPSLG